MVLPPRRVFCGVPSISIIFKSNSTTSGTPPIKRGANSDSIIEIAFETPRPIKRLGSLSRKSQTAKGLTDAPVGTDATKGTLSSRTISHSNVGKPRESKISLADTPVIFIYFLFCPLIHAYHITRDDWHSYLF